MKTKQQIQDNEFKQTELGEIPREWDVKVFSACIDKVKAPKKIKFYQPEYKKYGKYAIVHQGQELLAGYHDDESRLYQGKLPIVIFGDVSRTFKFIDFPFSLGADGSKIISPKRDLLDAKYFFYYLKTLEIPSKGYNRHYKDLKEKWIIIPLFPEQKSIAYVLSTVQEAKEKSERTINSLKEYKKSMMKHLFIYGVVPLEDIDKVELKETEIGKMPKDWDVVKLSKVFKLTSGKTRPNNLKKYPTNSFPYQVYGGNGIMGYSDKNFVNFNTIVIGRVGEYCGAVYLTRNNCWISDNALYAKEFLAEFNLFYLAEFLKYLNINQFKNTGGQPLISQSIIYSKSIPKPSLSEQLQISEVLSSIDSKIEAEEQKKEALEQLFKSLLHNLMSGKIRVRDLEIEK